MIRWSILVGTRRATHHTLTTINNRSGLLQAVRQEARACGATQLLAHAPLRAPVVGPLPPAKEGGGSSSSGDGGASAGAEENPALSFLRRKGGFRDPGTEGIVYTDRRGRPCRRLVAPL